MDDYLPRFWGYLIKVFLTTFDQLFSLFGLLLVLVILLSFSARLTARLSVGFWGRNLFLYGFSWLGTSVHELAHAFFALVFGHKITEIALFEPNKDGSSLGHVAHTCNKRNIYQQTGNFFIGVGPVLVSGFVLFLATYIIFRFDITKLSTFSVTSKIFTDVSLLGQVAINLKNSLLSFYFIIFPANHVVWWKVAVFAYILYSIGGSMTLSSPDVKSSVHGFLWVVVFFLLFNLSTLWIGHFIAILLTKIAVYISCFHFLLLLSLIANIVFVVALFLLNLIKNLFVARK